MTAALSWDKCDAFMRNPGERWIGAYRNLSDSEKCLLLAVLDAGDAQEETRIRKGYEDRVASIKDHLSWTDSLTRLTHSFLSRTKSYAGSSYIDFQHPSLRDMILAHLREDPVARRQYISIASPTGVAELMLGLADVSRDTNASERFDIVRSVDEVKLLTERIAIIAVQALPFEQWASLLSSALLLIPQSVPKTKPRKPPPWNLWEPSQIPPVAPSDLNLSAFRLTPQGEAAFALTSAFASHRTFDGNTQYDARRWTRLIEDFYILAAYFQPPIYLEWVGNLIAKFIGDDLRAVVTLANLIAEHEPLAVTQSVSTAARGKWDAQLRVELDDRIAEGMQFEGIDLDDFEGDEAYGIWNKYDDWAQGARSLVALAPFYDWSGLPLPRDVMRLESLEDGLILSEPEEREEPERDDFEDRRRYFDVDAMFSDL